MPGNQFRRGRKIASASGLTLFLVTIIGILDRRFGSSLPVVFLYLLPIALASLRSGLFVGNVIAIGCLCFWDSAHHISVQSGVHPLVIMLELATMLVTFSATAWIFAQASATVGEESDDAAPQSSPPKDAPGKV